MNENKTIQVICDKDFKEKVEAAAKKDKRSTSSYAYVAIKEKMERDSLK